jgi:hypothetical protein
MANNSLEGLAGLCPRVVKLAGLQQGCKGWVQEVGVVFIQGPDLRQAMDPMPPAPVR